MSKLTGVALVTEYALCLLKQPSGAQVVCSDDPDCTGVATLSLLNQSSVNVIAGLNNNLGVITDVRQRVQGGQYIAQIVVDGPSAMSSTTSISFSFIT